MVNIDIDFNPDRYFCVSLYCPKCKIRFTLPPNIKPQVRDIYECPDPLCHTNILITGITDLGGGKGELEIVRVSDSYMEEEERDGNLEEICFRYKEDK
jgi:hypothetical protein